MTNAATMMIQAATEAKAQGGKLWAAKPVKLTILRSGEVFATDSWAHDQVLSAGCAESLADAYERLQEEIAGAGPEFELVWEHTGPVRIYAHDGTFTAL